MVLGGRDRCPSPLPCPVPHVLWRTGCSVTRGMSTSLQGAGAPHSGGRAVVKLPRPRGGHPAPFPFDLSVAEFPWKPRSRERRPIKVFQLPLFYRISLPPPCPLQMAVSMATGTEAVSRRGSGAWLLPLRVRGSEGQGPAPTSGLRCLSAFRRERQRRPGRGAGVPG